MKLRDYQLEVISQVKRAYEVDHDGVFIVMPTGAGKTVVFSHLIGDWVAEGKRCVIAAHRQELIEQAGRTVNKLGMFHGVIKASNSTFPMAPVQICSIDSMRTRRLPWEPDYIILDEAHLSKSQRYKTFLDRHPNAKRLLVSATPWRYDGSGFTDIASVLVVGTSINKLVNHDDGPFLVPAKMYRGSDLKGLDQVKKTAGDYNQGQLETFMMRGQLVGDIVGQYLNKANGRKGVVFCTGIQHSMIVAKLFNDAGIRAEHLDGSMDEATRKGILQRLRDGGTRIVTNAMVLCEGWDEPTISYVGLARPTKSEALYIQQSGRGLRIDPDNPNKTDCVIIDHANNVQEHGHIQEERLWTLHGREKFGKTRKKQLYFECPKCDTWYKRPTAETPCPECGWVKPKEAPKFNTGQSDASYDEVEAIDMPPMHREYRKALKLARKKGYKDGWAYYALVKKFGPDKVGSQLSYGDSRRIQKQLTEEEAAKLAMAAGG